MGKSDELIIKNDYAVEFEKKDCVSLLLPGVSLEFYNICGFVLIMLKADEEAEESSRINVEFLTTESTYKELVFGR